MGLTEDGGMGGWSYTRINYVDGNTDKEGAVGNVTPSGMHGRDSLCKEGRGTSTFYCPQKPASSSHTNTTEPRSNRTALVLLFAGSKLGCALGRGTGPSPHAAPQLMPIPGFYILQGEAAASPRLQQSSVSLESWERDDEPGTLRQLQSKIFPCYRQLTLPCKTPEPVSPGAQKEHSSRPGSTSITADTQEGARCNLHAERHLKMRGKRKQQTIIHRGLQTDVR